MLPAALFTAVGVVTFLQSGVSGVFSPVIAWLGVCGLGWVERGQRRCGIVVCVPVEQCPSTGVLGPPAGSCGSRVVAWIEWAYRRWCRQACLGCLSLIGFGTVMSTAVVLVVWLHPVTYPYSRLGVSSVNAGHDHSHLLHSVQSCVTLSAWLVLWVPLANAIRVP